MGKTKSITIIGKRWLDRINGNTYHSVVVLVNGEEKIRVPFAYGYGDQYLQTAEDKLRERGYIQISKYVTLQEQCKWNKIAYYNFVSDVSRKKDL